MPTSFSMLRASALAASMLSIASPALAAPPTKDECVDAHSKGQDAREANQLVRAGKLFLTCAQSTCPDLVRGDCARFADELARLQPTVTFAARDGASRDLPDTSVYVDGTLITSQLGDGKAYDVDPGRHDVRFVHGSDETTITVVVGQGEKGRAVVGTFSSGTPASPATATPAAAPAADRPEATRPGGPLVLVGLGAAATVAGGVLLGLGFAKMPNNCKLSEHTCAAPPNDPVFGTAKTSTTWINAGAITGAVGLAALGGSLIWYFAQPLRPAKAVTAFTPWIGPQGAGLSFSGHL
ncbi:Hypothetical protein A7982_04081 [Minicystis rosea]|nr:Hypothetical protein A7982_04081 [Minicystis rosea]